MDQHIANDLWGAIDGLRNDIRELMVSGCARRNGDLLRIQNVEQTTKDQGVKLDKIYYISLVAAGGIIMLLLRSLFSLISLKP